VKITTAYLSGSPSPSNGRSGTVEGRIVFAALVRDHVKRSSDFVRSSSSEVFVMKVFLTGVSCVGKTTIGAKLASLLGYPFFDLDHEIETFFGKPLERLQAECLSKQAFRKKACQALRHLLAQDETENCVIALPPSGLMGEYPRLIKQAGGIAVVLEDTPENILARIITPANKIITQLLPPHTERPDGRSNS
jgi:shikimate kinase